MTKNQKIGILGYGEVGQAISKFYPLTGLRQAKIKDLKRDDGLKGVDILHVCVPWSDKFIQIAKKEIEQIKPSLTIIHSTVTPGTTKKLALSLSKGLGMIVHSPVRGVHPHLHKGIKTFVKYIGADNGKAGQLAKKHLESLGIKTKLVFPSMTTESLKLWDTTQYGWFIVLNKEIKKWCEQMGVDFDIVYTHANQTYNEGYKKLGRHEVVRPNLKYMPGKIGGHCIAPNAYLLESEITRFIIDKNNRYKHDTK